MNVDEVALVVSFLPIDEMIKCRRVNHVWKNGVHSDQAFWKKMYCEYYRIDRYYLISTEEATTSTCWLLELLNITWKIPKKQNDNFQDVPYIANSMEIANNYKSFLQQQDDNENYYCTNTVLTETSSASFKFRKEIPVNVEDVLDHYIITIMCDSLTVGGYTPNLLVDKVKAHFGDYTGHIDTVVELPLLTFLSCFLRANDCLENCTKLAQDLVSFEKLVQYSIGLNVENFTSMIYPMELIECLKPLKLENPYENLYLSDVDGPFRSYFNAGGGYTDHLNLNAYVSESDRRIVNIERSSKREYY